MKAFIRRMFCRHDYFVLRWHWVHGPIGNTPLMIEAEVKCGYCGKIKYVYPERGSREEKYLIERRQDKQD